MRGESNEMGHGQSRKEVGLAAKEMGVFGGINGR